MAHGISPPPNMTGHSRDNGNHHLKYFRNFLQYSAAHKLLVFSPKILITLLLKLKHFGDVN